MVDLRLLLATFAAWANRRQAGLIAYLVEENRVLKEQLESGGKRLRLTDDQRRRLAAKGKPLGRRALEQIATIVTPDTILAWHRRLIAAKWAHAKNQAGPREYPFNLPPLRGSLRVGSAGDPPTQNLSGSYIGS